MKGKRGDCETEDEEAGRAVFGCNSVKYGRDVRAAGCCRCLSVPYGFCLEDSDLGKILCLDEKCKFQD